MKVSATMHLKETNVEMRMAAAASAPGSSASLDLAPPESRREPRDLNSNTVTPKRSNFNNQICSSIHNNNSSDSTSNSSKKHVSVFNNNNNEKALRDPPELIISSGCVSNCVSPLVAEDGMSDSPGSTQSPEDYDALSVGSDRVHHTSISSNSGRPQRHLRSPSNCSLCSIDNDESDLESYSSLEVDINTRLHQRPGSSTSFGGLVDGDPWPVTPSSVNPWPVTPSSITDYNVNDLSPHLHYDNNVNQLSDNTDAVKSFYNKPKLIISSIEEEKTKSNENILNNNEVFSDKNGNLTSNGNDLLLSCAGSKRSRNNSDSACYTSDDENPCDIDQKMAETKVKMNDSILSNGKEELAFHGRKLKHGHNMKHKEMKEHFVVKNHSLALKLPDTNQPDNRYSQAPESPIVDAYEKECLDQPEKMVRELENQAKECQEAVSDTDSDIVPRKKEKMEINEIMKSSMEEIDSAAKEVPSIEVEEPKITTISEEEKGNKENDAPEKADNDTSIKSRNSRVTFGGVEEVVVKRRDASQKRRDRSMRYSVPLPLAKTHEERNKLSSPELGEFDVYTMETAMPKIDWDAIEAHLKATKEDERRRRNDREEIRRKLAMGFDEDFERPLRKPSLQSRLQSGMNLQICFMNETASDCESQCSDTESTQDRIEETVADVTGSTTSLNIKGSTPVPTKMRKSKSELTGAEPMDFFGRQAQLQAEARMALGQAKEMARMQMEIEKQQKKKSPIADIVRESMLKIGVHFPDNKRRVSRQILTDMNIAQLQVIVNDLHTQIETLNGDLVTMLLERDDLHMEQDSMLVDIEDLTKHMGAKEMSLRETKSDSLSLQNAPRCSPKMTVSPKRPRSKSLKLTGSPRK